MTSPVADAFSSLLRTDPSAVVAWTPGGVRGRGDLDAAARAVDTLLLPVAPGSRVAVSVRDGFRFLACVLALWRRGDCALLLDAADPRAPRCDLATGFGAVTVLVDEPELRCVRLGEGAGEAAGPYAAIKLTSGSTALPRAVAVTAEQLLADATALERTMGIGDGDRIFGAVPMSFSYGVGNLLLPALAHGRELVLPDLRHPAGILQALRQGAPTVLPAVPSLVRALLHGSFTAPASLRLVLSAGGVLSASVARAFRESCGLPVHAFYGATESGGICYDRSGGAAERGAVGEPIDGVEVTIAPDGLISVRSPAVGTALGDDDNPRDSMFCAPDLGTFCDGELVLLGRAGDAFDVGGHKVHPLEVERVIAELAGVDDVSVVPWRDEHGRAACAAVVASTCVDEITVRRHCVERLPSSKVPRRVLVLAELPRTCRGKLPRHEVEQLLRAGHGEGGAS